MSDVDLKTSESPKDLFYAEILNARENSKIISGVPTIDTNNLIPIFEVVSGRYANGTSLDESFMSYVSISNVDINATTINYSKAGVITIEDENKFNVGEYYFSVKVTTSYEGNVNSTIFEDVFHLTVGPQLVKDLLFSPIAQNLVVGTGNTTTKPYLLSGNPDVKFSLGSNEEKLNINDATGVISLKEGYATVENDTLYPKVIVTSNISGETTEFQGDSFLMLVASNEPVILPKKTIYFFYPTLQAENTLYGYKKGIISLGSVSENSVWIQDVPSPMAKNERPADVSGNKAIWTNLSVGDYLPHESFVTINPQDLTLYKLGYNVSTVFYIQNQYVEYMPSGQTPADLEVFISTDYTGDDATSTWTQINDQLSCQINSLTATPFIGTPYPGDQKLGGGDPDGKKDPTKNADAKWVRCEFDLNAYKNIKTFALKFKIASYYTGPIKGVGSSRPGRFYLSDVHFKASEE